MNLNDEWRNRKTLNDYREWQYREQARSFIAISKVYELEQDLDDDALLVKMLNFVSWQDKYQKMQSKRGEDTPSNIISLLFEYALTHGTRIENDCEISRDSLEYRGFVINVTHSESTEIWMTYKGKTIL